MRLRKVKGAAEAIAASPFVIHEPNLQKGHWMQLFGNDHPLHLEIGMGKGKFLTTLSALHPDINYLGMERYDSVLYRALEKRKEAPELSNLFFLCEDASELEDLFAPGEVSRIYLNFSDPWPKERHAKRRLTSKEFFSRYEKILSEDGEVIFKTDNRPLFEFSLAQSREAGWSLSGVTYDLHHSEFAEGNILTEYEERFSTLGNPIYRLVAKRQT